MLWTGIAIVACNARYFNMWHIICSLLSPLFVATLLINVSGVNLLEAASDKKWGEDLKYRAYKKTTPVLIPFIGRKGNAAF